LTSTTPPVTNIAAGSAIVIDTTAPTTQNTVLGASITVAGGGSVTIASSGAASNNVWLAPSGTTTFTAGITMTKAASGTATSIIAPATAGAYKIFVIDAVGNVSNASNATVTVNTIAPTQTFSALSFSTDTGTSSSDFITNTAGQTISATLSAVLGTGDKVLGSLNGGRTWTDITVKVSGTALAWNAVTLTASNTLKLKVQDAVGNNGTIALQAYVLDTTVPTTTVASKTFSADTGSSATDFITNIAAQTISGTLSVATVTGEIIQVSLDNGTTWATASNTIGQTTWSLTATLTGNNTLQVRVTDTAGNSGTPNTQTYVLDTTTPTITLKLPAATATSVAVNAGVNITFSEPMNTATITTSSFTVKVGNLAITGTITHNSGNIETFIPSANMASNTLHTVAVSNAITDLAGNTLTASGWGFTTVQTYSVGGSVSGLAIGESVILQDNLADNLTVSTNTIFTFATSLANAATYSVSVLTSPAGKTCMVSHGSGTISGASVSNVNVFCFHPLNDTGITTWDTSAMNNIKYALSAFPAQDADKGRDALAVARAVANLPSGKVGGSTKVNGFDFTSVANCVQDNNTGLMWEVKATAGSGGLRDTNNTYTWYNTNAATNGGMVGIPNGGVCIGNTRCDTEKYVADVNALTGTSRLCGFTDWRLPTIEELLSIVDNSFGSFGSDPIPGISAGKKTIDRGYFPNTTRVYWSASPYAGQNILAWAVDFNFGTTSVNGKNVKGSVRLVRGGQ